MSSPTKTPPPPIYTADNVALEVGSLVYALDTNCRHDGELPFIEPCQVTFLDLGVNRQVRLRRPRGTEWIWSAQDNSGSCRTADQYIFAKYENARDLAVEVIPVNAGEEIDARIEDHEYYVRQAEASLQEKRENLEKWLQKKADYEKSLKELLKSKAPKNPFESTEGKVTAALVHKPATDKKPVKKVRRRSR